MELVPTEVLKDGWLTQDKVYPENWWLKRYWESTDGSQRDAIIRALEHVGEFTSVFEIGCNTGPNLRRIHQRWPHVDLAGMDIHPGAIHYGRAAALVEGWTWTGYPGDLRELGLLGKDIADVVLSCYSLAYLDPRDITQALTAALACAKKALVICEPMVLGETTDELYAMPSTGIVAEYHYHYQGRVARLLGPHRVSLEPVTPPHQRLQHVLTILK